MNSAKKFLHSLISPQDLHARSDRYQERKATDSESIGGCTAPCIEPKLNKSDYEKDVDPFRHVSSSCSSLGSSSSSCLDLKLRGKQVAKVNTKSSGDPRASIEKHVTSTQEASKIVSVSGILGPDPSSANFTDRTKSIAFVICLDGEWFQINQNFFNQNSDYNDFSGGYKRFYKELPSAFIECAVTQRLLKRFGEKFNIEEGNLVLVQVQRSNILTAQNNGRCITGQGIHSDGADNAMLVCLERVNITGARNSIFEDILGEQPLIDRHTLEVGEALFWSDNEIYHYVEPARLEDDKKKAHRTVLIAHFPAMQYITGEVNPNNTLPPSGKHPRYVQEGLWK